MGRYKKIKNDLIEMKKKRMEITSNLQQFYIKKSYFESQNIIISINVN